MAATRFVPSLLHAGSDADPVDGSDAFSWTAGPFGPCSTGCSGGARRFRNITCRGAFDGTLVADGSCVGRSGLRPPASEPCACGVVVCQTVAPGECPSDDASQRTESEEVIWEELGCADAGEFGNPPQASGTGSQDASLDQACFGAPRGAAEPCLGGFPFYRLALPSPDPERCFAYCASKALDLFAVLRQDDGGAVCRCGASRLNEEVWRWKAPPTGLAFRPDSLRAVGGDCRLRVYRYAGAFEGGAVPEGYWDFMEHDTEYRDSIVLGKTISEVLEEHDGSKEASADVSASEVNGFDRPCYPHNCGPSFYGPWNHRVQTAPQGIVDVWEEYSVIPYVFEGIDEDDSRRPAFRAALAMYAETTCVVFQEFQKAPVGMDYLAVRKDEAGCHTYGLGRPSWSGDEGTYRIINLGWCSGMLHKGNIAHELGHIIGMNHEHKRPDASRPYFGHGPFLKMHWDKIPYEWQRQYTEDATSYTGSADDGEGDPHAGWAEYDYESIMHYGRGDDLFETVRPQDNELVGQRAFLSTGDVEQVNDMYQCKRIHGTAFAADEYEVVSSCSFEYSKDADGSYCGQWSDATDDDFDWTSTSGGTPTYYTGPEHAADGARYLYLEASYTAGLAGGEAVLRSKALPVQNGMRLRFKYSLYGGNIGELKVMAKSTTADGFTRRAQLWGRSKTYPDGDWHIGDVELGDRFAGQVIELQFVAVQGNRLSIWWENDIAIDQVDLLRPVEKVSTTSTTFPPAAPSGAQRRACLIWGDPHVQVFDATGPDAGAASYNEMLSVGDYWLVRSRLVGIQGRYITNNWTHGAAATGAFAVGGAFLREHILIIEPLHGQVTWDGRPILEDLPSSFEVPDVITAHYHEGGVAVSGLHVSAKSVELELPLGVRITVNRWGLHVDALIEMEPVEGGQDGHCGNLNGNLTDDSADDIASRSAGAPLEPAVSFFVLHGHEAPITAADSETPTRTMADCEPALMKRAERLCSNVEDVPKTSCVFDVCFGGEGYAESDAAAGVQMGVALAAAPIRWGKDPRYCVDVGGSQPYNGSAIQLWKCENRHPDMLFRLPAAGTGLIRWAKYPRMCADVFNGAYDSTHNGTRVQLWQCDVGHRNMEFVVPSGTEGSIRWAADTSMCLEVLGENEAHSGLYPLAAPLHLRPCSSHGDPSQAFLFE